MISKEVEFLRGLLSDEERMADTINTEKDGFEQSPEYDCYKLHQKNIMSLKACIRKLAAFEKVVDVTLNPTAVDLVRCGIGANYGGVNYEKMCNKVHAPIFDLAQEHFPKK